MNQSTGQISNLQLCMLLLANAGISVHVTIIPILLQICGRDAWLSVLLETPLYLLWIWLIYSTMKKTRQEHFSQWVKQRWGSFVSWLLLLPVLVNLFLVAATTMRDVSYWTNISYLQKTPNLVLVVCFSLITFYSAYSGLQSMAIANGVLLPFVLVFGFFVAFSNIPNKDYSLLFPLLEHGWSPLLRGWVDAGWGFIEMMFVLFLQHHLRERMSITSLLLTGFFVVWLTLGPIMGAIAEFGPTEAARQRFTSFEEWRLITFGHFIEHVDFLSIYQWLVGAFTRIALSLYLIPEILQIREKRKRTWVLAAVFVAMMVATQFPASDMKYMEWIKQYYLPFSFYLMFSLSLLFAFLVWFQSRKEA